MWFYLFAFCSCETYPDQRQLGRRGAYWNKAHTFRMHSITEGRWQELQQGRNLHAGTEEKVTKKHFLLACSPRSLGFYFVFMYGVFVNVWVLCLHVCLHARRGRQISLQMAGSHHVMSGNWTQDLWKYSQCSQPLSHLSSPLIYSYQKKKINYLRLHKLKLFFMMYYRIHS